MPLRAKTRFEQRAKVQQATSVSRSRQAVPKHRITTTFHVKTDLCWGAEHTTRSSVEKSTSNFYFRSLGNSQGDVNGASTATHRIHGLGSVCFENYLQFNTSRSSL